jgi:hypothetical protein
MSKKQTKKQIIDERDNLFLKEINDRILKVQKEIKVALSSIENAKKILTISNEKQLRLEGSVLVLKEIKSNLEK